jgi:hypothetical protein
MKKIEYYKSNKKDKKEEIIVERDIEINIKIDLVKDNHIRIHHLYHS